jgi:hypothetical protein
VSTYALVGWVVIDPCVGDENVPCASSTRMADKMLFPDAGRSGVLKYLKPLVIFICSVYCPKGPLSRPNTVMLPRLPAGKLDAKFSQAQPYCCFLRTFA